MSNNTSIGQSVAVDRNCNVYTAGVFSGQLKIAGSPMVSSSGVNTGFVNKLNSNLEQASSNYLFTTGTNTSNVSLAVHPNGTAVTASLNGLLMGPSGPSGSTGPCNTCPGGNAISNGTNRPMQGFQLKVESRSVEGKSLWSIDNWRGINGCYPPQIGVDHRGMTFVLLVASKSFAFDLKEGDCEPCSPLLLDSSNTIQKGCKTKRKTLCSHRDFSLILQIDRWGQVIDYYQFSSRLLMTRLSVSERGQLAVL
jgi:hypothetical protein